MSKSCAGGEAQGVCSPLMWLCAGGMHGTLLSRPAPPQWPSGSLVSVYLVTYNSLQVCIAHCRSVAQLCLTLCDPTNCSTPDFPVVYYLPEFAQTHFHGIGDAIQPSHCLSLPSPSALNLSQHQGLFQ